MAERLAVGFIGLGNQGAPIAHRILAAGWPLHVWARRPEILAEFAAKGAVVAASPGEVAARSDILGICVRTDDDVRDVLLRAGDGCFSQARPGALILLHSTLSPATVAEVGAAAAARGLRVLDAPVSGGPQGAAAGTMTVLAGGDAEDLARARPVLETFATDIPLLGPLGAGQMMKLLNNNLCYANVVTSIFALQLAESLGMDPAVAASVMRVSSGASTGLEIVHAEATLRKITGPTSNLPKDVGHLVNLIAARGLSDEPLTAISATAWDRVRDYAAHKLGQAPPA